MASQNLFEFDGQDLVREFSFRRSGTWSRLTLTLASDRRTRRLLFENPRPLEVLFSIIDADQIWIWEQEGNEDSDAGRFKVEFWKEEFFHFTADSVIDIVTLDVQCRQQQVGEGHFATLDDVPAQAITLTVPALLKPAHVLAVVPEERKAAPVKAALEGPVTPDCPASILRTQSHVKLYLDRDSASLV